MDETTARLELPLIVPGQAGKEIAHNEALSRLAMVVQPIVEAANEQAPPVEPLPGQAWIVGDDPVGAWLGHPRAIAGWTAGGWRFVRAEEGMTAWIRSAQLVARFVDGGWTIGDVRAARLLIDGNPSIGAPQPALSDPGGGDVIDVESRRSIASVLAVLRHHGLIAV